MKNKIAPVMLFVFNRPDKLSKVFEVIKKVKPETLILVSDGPRTSIPNEKYLVEESRRIVDNIDWVCDVHKIYSEINQGLYTTMWDAFDYIFSLFDRVIVLEDDVVPTESFFTFTSELLEKYKDDKRIQRISGMNFLGEYPLDLNKDYFFAKEASIWGFAFWKRIYLDFDRGHKYSGEYVDDQMKSKMPKQVYKEYMNYQKSGYSNGHMAGLEYFFGLHKHLYNTTCVIPRKNLISNIGFGMDSMHSNDLKTMPKGQRRMFNMETSEINLLNYNDHIIEDNKYNKKVLRITGTGHPIIILYRKIVLLSKIFIHLGILGVLNKIKKKMKTKNET